MLDPHLNTVDIRRFSSGDHYCFQSSDLLTHIDRKLAVGVKNDLEFAVPHPQTLHVEDMMSPGQADRIVTILVRDRSDSWLVRKDRSSDNGLPGPGISYVTGNNGDALLDLVGLPADLI